MDENEVVWDDDVMWDDDPGYKEYMQQEHPYAQKLEEEYTGKTRKDMSEYAPEPMSDYPPMLKAMMTPAHGVKTIAEGAVNAVKGLEGLMYVDPGTLSEEGREDYARRMLDVTSLAIGGGSLTSGKLGASTLAANKIGTAAVKKAVPKAAKDTGVELYSMIPVHKAPKIVSDAYKSIVKRVIGKKPVTAKEINELVPLHRNKELYTKTGFWLGKDDKWRYEIDSNKIKIKPEAAKAATKNIEEAIEEPMLLKDAIDYPELFKAVPEMKNVKFEIDSSIKPRGHFDHSTKTLRLKDLSYKDTIGHEIQHGVNKQLGAFSGSSVKYELSKAANKFMDKIDSEMMVVPPKMHNIAISIHDAMHAGDAKKANTFIGMLNYEKFNKSNEVKAVIDEALDLIHRKGSASYMKVPGEMEARLIRLRAKMTAKQRKEEPPWETLDKMLIEEGRKEYHSGVKFNDIIDTTVGYDLYSGATPLMGFMKESGLDKSPEEL